MRVEADLQASALTTDDVSYPFDPSVTDISFSF